jgi:hypothetical protein
MVIGIHYDRHDVTLHFGTFACHVVYLPVLPGLGEVGQKLIRNLGLLVEVLGNGKG